MALRAHVLAGMILCAIALAGPPVHAEPVTVFSNFGPDFEFQTASTSGWTINGFLNPSTGQQAISERFVPAHSFSFDGARV